LSVQPTERPAGGPPDTCHRTPASSAAALFLLGCLRGAAAAGARGRSAGEKYLGTRYRIGHLCDHLDRRDLRVRIRQQERAV